MIGVFMPFKHIIGSDFIFKFIKRNEFNSLLIPKNKNLNIKLKKLIK